MDKITEQMLRMAHLSNNPVDVKTLSPIECDPIELTEQEWKDFPMNQKIILEGKKHVVSFQNKFVLKPVNIKTDDNGNATTNKLSDYENDGGDASKANKKMLDNDTSGGTELVKEREEISEQVGSATDDQREAGEIIYRHLRGNKPDHEITTDYNADDDDYKERERKKKQKEKAEELLKNSSLSKATIGEQYENKQEFDDADADEYYGLDRQREDRVKIPKKLTSSINSRIKEISASIDHYDQKGYNDGDGENSNKIKAIKALEQIKSNLSLRTEEGMKQAKLFFLTLMSPITDLFPADVVNFLAKGHLDNDKSNYEIVKKVEPFKTSLKESINGKKNFMFNNMERFNKFFLNEAAPQMNISDEAEFVKEYKNYVDQLVKHEKLPPIAENWTAPSFNQTTIVESNVRKLSEILEEQKKAKKDPCWKGYTQVGMKKKKGKAVPNCVPSDGVEPKDLSKG